MKTDCRLLFSSPMYMINPWLEISWEHPYAQCDEEFILNPKYKNKLQIFGTLPEPFTGDVKSNVVCLNGNPGGMDKSIIRNEVFLKETCATLDHSSGHFMWLSSDLKGTGHGGCKWWEKRTKALGSALKNEIPRLFVLEFFPYHSDKMFKFPVLPSDSYRNFLLRRAMDSNKLIVIMRAKNSWYSISDDNLGNDLKEYPNKITLNNPQNVYLTKGNMGNRNWERLIETLQKPME